MDLLRWVAEGSNIFGLMVYSAGMILIAGALVLANYADNRQDEQKQSANRQPRRSSPFNTAAISATPAVRRTDSTRGIM